MEGKPRFRSGQDSLEARVEKKLTEKYNWFRKKKKREEKEKEERSECFSERNKDRKEEGDCEVPKSVLFVQNTPDSQLAKVLER